jgi:hypothetical protein
VPASAYTYFGLIHGRGLLSSKSLPFVIDRFTYGGEADISTTDPGVTITGTPRPARRLHPLWNSVANFSP